MGGLREDLIRVNLDGEKQSKAKQSFLGAVERVAGVGMD